MEENQIGGREIHYDVSESAENFQQFSRKMEVEAYFNQLLNALTTTNSNVCDNSMDWELAFMLGEPEIYYDVSETAENSIINATNCYGRTPLCSLLRSISINDMSVSNALEMVENLIKQGADPNVKYINHDYSFPVPCYQTPLRLAAGLKDHRILELLIRAGAKLDAIALFDAALHRRHKNMKILVQHGIDVNFHIPRPMDLFHHIQMTTPIKIAAFFGDRKMFKFLMKHGADFHAVAANDTETAMHCAVQSNKIGFLKFLMKKYDFDLTVKYKNMESLPAIAACQTSFEVFHFLLCIGATFNFQLDATYLLRRIKYMPNHEAVLIGKLAILENSVQPVSDRFLVELRLYHKFAVIEKNCKEEIEGMKGETVSPHKKLSLYDFIMRDSYNDLKSMSIVQTLCTNKTMYAIRYPNYYPILLCKINIIKRLTNSFFKSCYMLNDTIGRKFNVPYFFFPVILKSLSNRDIKMLSSK